MYGKIRFKRQTQHRAHPGEEIEEILQEKSTKPGIDYLLTHVSYNSFCLPSLNINDLKIWTIFICQCLENGKNILIFLSAFNTFFSYFSSFTLHTLVW